MNAAAKTVPLQSVMDTIDSLRAELGKLEQTAPTGETYILVEDVPLQFRDALHAQAKSAGLEVDGKLAVDKQSVDAWMTHVVQAFHIADATEVVPGRSAMGRRYGRSGVADLQLDANEMGAAFQYAENRGITPLAQLVANATNAPAPVAPPTPKLGLLTKLRELMNTKVSPQLKESAIADGKVELHEVWSLINNSRDHGRVTEAEIADLTVFRDTYAHVFEPKALEVLDAFLLSEDPNGKPDSLVPRPAETLQDMWARTHVDWSLEMIRPPDQEVDPEEGLKRSLEIYSATNEDGYRLANETDAFFEEYPSSGARVFNAFYAGWAINETFHNHPLQAFNYSRTSPVGDDGKPKNARWQAYVDAIDAGAPREVVEETFFRAHIGDYKELMNTDTFKQLYALAPKDYRDTIDATFMWLRTTEADLDMGKDPVKVARDFPLTVVRELARRGTIGMVWTKASFKNGLNPLNSLTQTWWSGFFGSLGTFFTSIHPKTNKPTKIAAELSPQEATELSAELGIELPSGFNTLTPEDFKGATFRDLARGDGAEDRPRYPLLFEDFQQIDPLHRPFTAAGNDGVYQADEIRGVIRQAQSRVRSQLIQEFHEQYPVAIGGMLVYSANLLTMTGSYGQHEAYNMVPNYISPVDNHGNPKGPLWQKFVDAYEQHKETGAPANKELERYWFEAHMEDFKQVDSPEFREKIDDFWAKAAEDPKLAPLAIYFVAMVHGREVFEAASRDDLTYEQALVRSFDHFRSTLVSAKSFPYWQEDLRKVGKWFTSRKFRNMPELDQRGLPTDRVIFERALGGLYDMKGLAPTLARGGMLHASDDKRARIGLGPRD